MSERAEGFPWRWLHKRAVPLIVVMFVAAAGIVVWHTYRLSNRLVRTRTLLDAEHHSTVLREFRTLYTAEVVEIVRREGIEITHDYKGRKGAIPLPATLSMELGARIGEQGDGAKARLYSPYPFPWRKAEGGLRDEFQKAAWAAFVEDSASSYHAFAELDGRPVLRYATPDIMRSACVECHNTHPDSPKTDWKEGQVRGVLEVVLPMDRVADATRDGLRGTLLLMLGLISVGIGFLSIVIGRLRRTSDDLQRHVVELEERGERIRDIHSRLVVAHEEAKSASLAKSQFLANMSHELRTPLNAVIGYSEILLEEAGEMEPEAVRDDLEKIGSAGKNLLAMVNDVLDMITIERGGMELSLEPVSVLELLEDVAAAARAQADRNSNTLEIHCEPDAEEMRTDRAKVRRCLVNLVGNAVKFTRKGRVDVRATRERVDERDWIVFRVRDTGIGMSSDQIQGLFQEFSQLDSSSTREYGGIGMGLSLARKLCKALGGEITVESEPKMGSTFSLWVPARGEVAAPEAPSSSDPLEDGPGEVVLVIDDDPQARDLLIRHLRKEGFRPVAAPGGQEGIALALKHRPRAITLDVLMPKTDGWSVLAALKSDARTASIPVVMISMVDDRSRGFAMGAADYLIKPIDRSVLTGILERIRAGRAPGRVLVVDDDDSTRRLLARAIGKDGWVVAEAENGRIALDRLAAEDPPDAILLDLMMPVMDGFQFMQELRANDAWKSIPVIVVTAKQLTDDDRRQLDGHVERILAKGSLGSEGLLAEVSRLLRAYVPKKGGEKP